GRTGPMHGIIRAIVIVCCVPLGVGLALLDGADEPSPGRVRIYPDTMEVEVQLRNGDWITAECAANVDLNCDGHTNLWDYAIFAPMMDKPQAVPSPSPSPSPTPTPTPTPTSSPSPTAVSPIVAMDVIPFEPLEAGDEVGAWAFSAEGVMCVELSLDGRQIAVVPSPLANPRTQVREHWAHVPADCEPGVYTLSATAHGPTGGTSTAYEQVTIGEMPPAGTLTVVEGRTFTWPERTTPPAGVVTWYKSCTFVGDGRNSPIVYVEGADVRFTDCRFQAMGQAVRNKWARHCTATGLVDDFAQNASVVVGCTVNGLDTGSSSVHGDAYQIFGGCFDGPVIVAQNTFAGLHQNALQLDCSGVIGELVIADNSIEHTPPYRLDPGKVPASPILADVRHAVITGNQSNGLVRVSGAIEHGRIENNVADPMIGQ
ncbi:MAG: hypothetical protein SW127_18410, partial [Actinomycetota bacterium]|nr:hypothetical protein [Actinomycetota bacterium]